MLDSVPLYILKFNVLTKIVNKLFKFSPFVSFFCLVLVVSSVVVVDRMFVVIGVSEVMTVDMLVTTETSEWFACGGTSSTTVELGISTGIGTVSIGSEINMTRVNKNNSTTYICR